MKDNTLSNMRSKVIENFIIIETIINHIIASSYFDKYDKNYSNFYWQILYNENFTWALRRSILEKIVSGFDDKQMQNLRTMNQTRNLFAHTGVYCADEPQNTASTGKRRTRFIDPKNIDKNIDYQSEYDKFQKKFNDVFQYLLRIQPRLTISGGSSTDSQS